LIGFVERYVIVDDVAEALRDLLGEPGDAIGKARIEQPRSAPGGLDVEGPRVMNERNHCRLSRVADRLQHVAIVREGLVVPGAGVGLEPRPRERKAEHRTAEAARELDVLAIAAR